MAETLPDEKYGEVKDWDEVKSMGNPNYMTNGAEQIDLYKAHSVLRPWATCEIQAHALRNMYYDKITPEQRMKFIEDMNKIIHYAEILKAEMKEVRR